MGVTAKFSGVDARKGSALRRMLHDHPHASTSAVKLFVVGSVKVDDNFALLNYPFPFQCGKETETSSAPDILVSSGNYAWITQAMIQQSPVHLFNKDIPPPADLKKKFTEMAAASNEGTSQNTGLAVWLKTLCFCILSALGPAPPFQTD